jgi:nucleoid-associated protein
LPNVIINAAVHDLQKGAAGFVVALAQNPLPINPTLQRVIDELYDLYSRRTSKSHGRFAVDEANYPAPIFLRAYLLDSDFGVLTSELMNTLRLQAQRKTNATGGHVFFAHFERDAKQYLLVAIVNDKLGATLTRDLSVQDVKHLDMDGFRFAGRINLTGWMEGDARYIGFLKGKGDVSEYFREFLGCDATILERQDTADLVSALKHFAEAQGMDPAAKDDFLGRAKSICERASKQKQELEFQALANELMPAHPDVLLEVLTDPDRGLNDRFVPHRGALSPLVKFKAKTSLWSVEFEREALSGGNILFDEEENTLTILNLPPELSQQLRAEREVDAQA